MTRRTTLLAIATLAAATPLGISSPAVAATSPAGAAASASVTASDRRYAAGERIGRDLRALAERGGSTAEQREFVASALRARGLPARTVDRVIQKYSADGIALRRTTTPGVISRLGGAAPGVAGQAWPRNEVSKHPLSLYAVLDLAELRAPAPLPPAGQLAFFYDRSEDDLSEAWLDPVASAEVRWLPPGAAITELVAPKRTKVYKALSIAGTTMATFGGAEWVLDVPGRQKTREHVSDVMWGVTGTSAGSEQLLGASNDIQAPALTDIPLFFKEWASKGSRKPFTTAERKGRGWTLVAQFSGGGTDEMMIADAGIVTFWVPTTDLAAQRFDRAIATFQTA